MRKGFAAAAPHHDDIAAERAALGIHQIERDAVHGDDAVFLERKRVAQRFLRLIQPTARIRGEGPGEIEHTEAGFAAADEGEDVAQGIRAQSLEAFRHKGAMRVHARLHVGLGNLHVARRGAQDDARVVFLREYAGGKLAILRLHVEEFVARVDLPVRIDHADEQLLRSVRADACEHRADFLADLAKLVADGADLGKEFLAVFGIAGLRDQRSKLRDKRVLVGVRFAELVEHRHGPRGDFLVGMRAQPEEACRPENGDLHLLRIDGVEEGPGPLGAGEENIERGGLHERGQIGKRPGEQRPDRGIAGRAERRHGLALERVGNFRGEQLRDGRQNIRAGGARADEAGDGLRAARIGKRIVGQFRQQTRGHDLLHFGFQRAGFVPRGRERERGGAEIAIGGVRAACAARPWKWRRSAASSRSRQLRGRGA